MANSQDEGGLKIEAANSKAANVEAKIIDKKREGLWLLFAYITSIVALLSGFLCDRREDIIKWLTFGDLDYSDAEYYFAIGIVLWVVFETLFFYFFLKYCEIFNISLYKFIVSCVVPAISMLAAHISGDDCLLFVFFVLSAAGGIFWFFGVRLPEDIRIIEPLVSLALGLACDRQSLMYNMLLLVFFVDSWFKSMNPMKSKNEKDLSRPNMHDNIRNPQKCMEDIRADERALSAEDSHESQLTKGKHESVKAVVMLDTEGPEFQVVNKTEHPISLEAHSYVVLTPHQNKEASSILLPLSFGGLPKAVKTGDTIFIGQYLFTGSETTWVGLEVTEVKGEDVVCLVKNSATLAGSLFTLHVSQTLIDLPTLTEKDKEEHDGSSTTVGASEEHDGSLTNGAEQDGSKDCVSQVIGDLIWCEERGRPSTNGGGDWQDQTIFKAEQGGEEQDGPSIAGRGHAQDRVLYVKLFSSVLVIVFLAHEILS